MAVTSSTTAAPRAQRRWSKIFSFIFCGFQRDEFFRGARKVTEAPEKSIPDIEGDTAKLAECLTDVLEFVGEVKPRDIKDRRRNAVETETTATLVVTGGTGKVNASATAESLSSVENAVAKATASAIALVQNNSVRAKQGSKARAVSNVAAKAIGRAVATAITDASVLVEIDGDGIGTGTANATAEAIAEVIATAIAEAVGEATGNNVEATASASAEISQTAIVMAISTSSATATSEGGTAEAISSSVAEAVAEVIAEALANVLSVVEGGDATVDADAEARTDVVDESVIVDGTNESKVTGKGSANAEAGGEATTKAT